MSPSSDQDHGPAGFRSDAEMLAVVTRRAERRHAAQRGRQRLVGGGIAALVVAVLGAAVFASIRADDGDDGGSAEQVDALDSSTTGRDDPEHGAATSTTLTRDPLPGDAQEEGWQPMADSPLSPRANAISAWTGTELLVWGGEGETTDVCTMMQAGSARCGDQVRSDGAAYDPATDTWRMVADSPLPIDQGSWMRYGGAWTGTELVVWGGPTGVGAAYDPTTDRWRPIAAAPIGPRSRFGVVWTGREVLVVGGNVQGEQNSSASDLGEQVAAYDPDTDTWRLLPGLPEDRVDPELVVADERVMVLGGYVNRTEDDAGNVRHPPVLALDDGGWVDMGDPLVGRVSAAVWTGDRLVVSGSDPSDLAGTGPVTATFAPRTGTWTALPDPVDRVDAWRLEWTGSEVVLWPASDLGMSAGSLTPQVIDPEQDEAWRVLPAADLETVQAAAVAWTGSELLFWGGAIQGGYGNEVPGGGARYSPGPGG